MASMEMCGRWSGSSGVRRYVEEYKFVNFSSGVRRYVEEYKFVNLDQGPLHKTFVWGGRCIFLLHTPAVWTQ